MDMKTRHETATNAAEERRLGLTRRSFLGGTLSLTTLGAGAAVAGASPVEPARDNRATPAAQSRSSAGFTLWCASGGLIAPNDPSDLPEVEAFVDICASSGVTRLIGGSASRMLVDTARRKGLETHTYAALNSHGGLRMRFAWSCEFIRPPIGTPEAKPILNRHRPIWSSPTRQVGVSDFAKAHPELWAKNRGQSDDPGDYARLQLSPALPEARRHEVDRFLALLDSSGAAGVQAELVLANENEHGVDTNGYEPAMVEAYRQQFGNRPLDLPDDDPSWMQFRADHVTRLIRDVREALNGRPSPPIFTTTVIHREPEGYVKVLQDWPAWIEQQLVDEFHLWFRTTSSLDHVERHTREAAAIINGRCPLVVELSCYHPGSFQDPGLMLEAARRARANGATSVGIYRGHAVDQLDFWPVIERIAAL